MSQNSDFALAPHAIRMAKSLSDTGVGIENRAKSGDYARLKRTTTNGERAHPTC
jgi:hypothetical protein